MTFYKVHLSNKVEVEIDAQDYEKLKMGMTSGQFVQLKSAVINPAFVMAVVPFEKEVTKKIEGYIDPEKNVFVVKKEQDITPALPDKFLKN